MTAEHQQLEVSQQKSTIANGEYQVALDAFCADSDDPKPLLLPYLSKEPLAAQHGAQQEPRDRCRCTTSSTPR